MNKTSFIGGALLRSLAASVILTGIFASPVHGQVQKKEPKAIVTLDVCENAVTGKWIYSGVVSVPGASSGGTAAKVDYMVQNKVDGTGYQTSYVGAARALAGTATPVHSFSMEAPALTLGTMRGAAKVQLVDLANPARVTTFELVTPATHCGCDVIKGCVRTQGYWGNKPGVVWPVPYSRDALFFSSGLSFQEILDAPVRGSGYLILAKQYIAAMLNRAAGASSPVSINNILYEARVFFQSGTTPASCGPGECEDQKAIAGILDTYNNGLYPGAPGHCTD
jgi:hypothetical protein